MKPRQFSTEKGMTLVELLAALSLFAIVIALSSTVITQILNNEESTNSSITLKQNANVIVSELRNQYYEEDKGEGKLCFSNNDKELIVSEYTITNGTKKKFNKNSNCIMNVDYEQPLKLEMTFTSNDTNQNFKVKTFWENKKDISLSLNIEEECDDDSANCDDNDDEENNENAECRYFGAYEFENLTLRNGYCKNSYEIEGSLVVRNQLHIEENVKFKIFKASTHFQGDIILQNGAKIVSTGNSSVQVDGSIICGNKEIPFKKNATIHCKLK